MSAPEQPTCIICFTDKYEVKARCRRCKVLTCGPCDCNELRGLCPVCDRKELNRPRFCKVCNKHVHLRDYMVYDCGVCEEEFESCVECFENWKSHNESNCQLL